MNLRAVWWPTWVGPRALVLSGVAVCILVVAIFWRTATVDAGLVATVQRGALTATLTASGTLKPSQSITYRSPIVGRDVEIRDLAPEGTRVIAGDLLVRLDSTEVEREFERARQEVQQAQLDLEVGDGEWEEAVATVRAVSEGEGALAVQEARTHLQIAEKKGERLRQEYEQLRPLMTRGFITRDELAKTGDLLDQAEEELGLARKRTAVVVEMTHPREQKRAELQLTQKTSQRGRARARIQETAARLTLLAQLIDACRVYAQGPGMVVYEEYLSGNPRRKVRIGDRVTSSQGIVTIPEVNRMLVEASVAEAQVHRVSHDQAVVVHVEAYPDLRLTGKVTRVGTLASTSASRPLDEKRFDLTIALDPTPADLRPEMTVRADIMVGTRASVLLVPVSAVFKRQGTFVTYVIGRTGVDRRAVDLGESNGQLVEVVAGLREGDRIALTEPPMADTPAPAAPPPTPGDGLQLR
jgi:HlyD family secretion protein